MSAKPNAVKHNVEEQVSEAQWVSEMHRYFLQHGAYRAADLERVIGDPRKHVEIGSSFEPPINRHWPIKRSA